MQLFQEKLLRDQSKIKLLNLFQIFLEDKIPQKDRKEEEK